MSKLNTSSATLLGLLLHTLPALAAEPQDAAPAPWYQIELYIFAQNEDNLLAELWDERVTPGDPAPEALNLRPSGEPGDAPAAPSPYADGAFQRLGASAYTLPLDSERLSSRGYRPLFHAAWRQPVREREQAQAVIVTSSELLDDGTPVLSGTVELSISRYLHFASNLYFSLNPPPGWESMRPKGPDEAPSLPEPPTDASAAMSSGVTDSPAPPAAMPLEPLQLQVLTLQLQQSRRMRSSEIHYIDHPMFGVLVRISPDERPSSGPDPLLPAAEITPGASLSRVEENHTKGEKN